MNRMPDTIIPLRTSERSSFRQCRQQWWWGYVDRLSTVNERPALRFGTLVHEALAAYYKPGIKRGPHPTDTFVAVYRKEIAAGRDRLFMKGDPDSPNQVEADEFGSEILNNYIATYGKDDRFKILQPEQSFQLDVHHPKTGAYMFTYVSQMDAVIEDRQTKKIGLFEHKTSAGLEPFGAPLTLDEQASSYWTFGVMWLKAMGKIKKGQDLDFMLYNFLRKAIPDQRPRDAAGLYLNKDGTVSKRQPAPYFRREWVMRGENERVECYRRALNDHYEMEMVKAGKLAVVKTFGKHCGYCQFRDMCEVHEVGSDWEAMRDGMFTTWDPYEEHQEDLSGTDG